MICKQYAISSRMCFPESYLVTDRFRCKTNNGSLATLKNKIQMGGSEKENQAIKNEEQGLKHIPFTFENDDTPKQLLARSRIIAKTK
jgi:hypothetical protein